MVREVLDQVGKWNKGRVCRRGMGILSAKEKEQELTTEEEFVVTEKITQD